MTSSWWLGVIRQQAITWANVDPGLCRNMASLCHEELSNFDWKIELLRLGRYRISHTRGTCFALLRCVLFFLHYSCWWIYVTYLFIYPILLGLSHRHCKLKLEHGWVIAFYSFMVYDWFIQILMSLSQWTHDAIITSLIRQNDVSMSFWRNNDVIIASCVHRDAVYLCFLCCAFITSFGGSVWSISPLQGWNNCKFAMMPVNMMTSSNGSMFCVTGPLWGESTGHRWIWSFLWSAPEQTIEQIIHDKMISDTFIWITN